MKIFIFDIKQGGFNIPQTIITTKRLSFDVSGVYQGTIGFRR
jgi:hypothetical protein